YKSAIRQITNLRYEAVLCAKHMNESETIQCPFCGQTFELLIDTTVASQRFTTDCEICCRPFEVVVECQPGEILSLDVLGN
ncbi:MAG: CPXCG motif-containing cysteine-rich protein, partial [Verrucomicrobiota bacterium]